LLCSVLACAQDFTVTARVAWAKGEQAKPVRRAPSGVVVWLEPVGDVSSQTPANHPQPRLVQRNKMFDPHVLVVPAGSIVEFPNRDPFFHNVFSLFEGKRFDLGLYEAGSSREVHFNRPGVSYIFCNIHPEMSAVIIAISSPYYSVSDAQGQIVIPKVPAGPYTLHLWYEGAPQDVLESLTREVSISDRTSVIGILQLKPSSQPRAHKNKYGRDYDMPNPNTPGYDH
jgi:plastocyanin